MVKKKVLSHSLAIILIVMSIFTGQFNCSFVSASDINWGNVFSISYANTTDRYNVVSKSQWPSSLAAELGESSDLVFPDTYVGDEGEKPFYMLPTVLTNSETGNFPNIKSVTFNNLMATFGLGPLYRFPNIETVVFTAENLTLAGSIVYGTKSSADDINTYASKLKDVYINGETVKTINKNAFNYVNEQITIHVVNQTVKESILATVSAEDAPAPVKEEQIVVEALKKPSEVTITCGDIYVGAEKGFEPKATIVTGEADAEVTYELYIDSKCETRNDQKYFSPNLKEGTYYIQGTMASKGEYAMSQSNIVEVHVLPNPEVDKKALNEAITEAKQFETDNSSKKADYDADAWNEVYGVRKALALAQEIADDTDNKYSQSQVDTATTNLTTALSTLKNSASTVDNTEAWNQLQAKITEAEGYLAKQDDYTEESWTKLNLPYRITNAKALKKDEATVSEINSQIQLLEHAISGLVLKPVGPAVTPGDPFAFIPKKGAAVKVLSMTAPESLAGANKIRVTFKCADDVTFNEYASIDITAKIAATDNYQQIKGTGGEAGASHTVELDLSEAIKAGDSIELTVSTYSWDDAKDWVYGITAIDFVNADNEVLGSYIDKDVYTENLASAITEAEAINTSSYTDASVQKLTDAIAAAKALGEDATAAQMSAAIDAINAAIKGLERKDDDVEDAKVKLTAAVKEAEGIDTSLYTAESVEKLTKALEAAKALGDDATAEEIDQATEAINEAIKGLVKKDGSAGNGSQDPTTPGTGAQVLGTAKGRTFTAGNFIYKVSVAATINGTVKTAGKVTVTGLSTAGKKKSSISLKNTVSASGASYQVTGIGSKAFQKAAKLKTATLGTNVKSISASAFANCKKLTTVKATGVTKIAAKAFNGCKVLKKLTLGKKKLTSVKKGAFKGCKKTIKVAGGSKKVKKGNVTKLKKSGYKKFK